MRHSAASTCLVLLGILLPVLSRAIDVRVVAVTPGQSADVVIGDGTPVTIQVGQTVDEVTLLRADLGGAVLSADGTTETLPVVADGSIDRTPRRGAVTLSADARGHFLTRGAVNGRPMAFIVDTGATLTTLSRAEATRIGLDFSHGKQVKTQTANGEAHGWQVSLGSVSIGDVTVRDVDAMVMENDTLPAALLGMSFLGHFDMERRGSTLVLRRTS